MLTASHHTSSLLFERQLAMLSGGWARERRHEFGTLEGGVRRSLFLVHAC